ncbi:hypothetical protein OK016_19675 [Vibrio chagasii]|nr:hypothetical protein [Vibrio chagasii]
MSSTVFAENPVEAAKFKVEGAQVILTVKDAPKAFNFEFVNAARENFNNFHWQMGGDHSVYYNLHMSGYANGVCCAPGELWPLVKMMTHVFARLKVEADTKGELLWLST